MRRVLAACWGTDASAWAGRRVKLYCDESVMFGNDVVGGTRIAALSHIDKVKKVPLREGESYENVARVPWLQGGAPLPTSRAEKARGDVFSTINAGKRQALGEDYGQDFTGSENYQPPLAPGEIVKDVGSSILPAAAGVVEGTAGMLGDLADSRYTLAHYLNRKLSGGIENRTADDWLKTMEKYDPVSYIPSTEDVQGATDPIYEALGIKDAMRYQPQSPWGQGLYAAGQTVDPYAAGNSALRGGAKLLKKAM